MYKIEMSKSDVLVIKGSNYIPADQAEKIKKKFEEIFGTDKKIIVLDASYDLAVLSQKVDAG